MVVIAVCWGDLVSAHRAQHAWLCGHELLRGQTHGGRIASRVLCNIVRLCLVVAFDSYFDVYF